VGSFLGNGKKKLARAQRKRLLEKSFSATNKRKDDLAKLGYRRREWSQKKESPPSTANEKKMLISSARPQGVRIVVPDQKFVRER